MVRKSTPEHTTCSASASPDSFEALADEYGVILSYRDDLAGAVHVLRSLRDGCIPYRTATSYLEHVYAEDDGDAATRLSADNVAQVLDEEELLLQTVEEDIRRLQPRLRAAWGRHRE